MDLEITAVQPSDYPEAFEPIALAFGHHRFDEEELGDARLQFDDDAMIGVRDGDRWVGTLGAYPFGLTLPGGSSLAVPGITAAAVSPTHRRQGILTALLDRYLDDATARGAGAAVLLSQEAGIYGRFGFGVASQYVEAELDAAGVVFREPLADPGSFVMPDPVEGSALAEQVWDRHLSWRPGTLTRRPWAWELLRRDRAAKRTTGGPFGWVVHLDATGAPDGYAVYRIRSAEDAGRARSVASAYDVVGVDAEVEALVVRFLAQLDLVHRLELAIRPVDDPLRWRLADPRQLVTRVVDDFLWLRVLDVEAAFGARAYGSRDRLVVEVRDDRRPAVGGRFAFDGGAGGGSCTRTDEPVDLALGVAELGSLLLGTLDPSVLASAGRVTGSPEVLVRADALFRSTPRPFCSTRF